jgi:hypothetical protein
MSETGTNEPGYYRRAFWCAFGALILAFGTLILRLAFLEQGGCVETATFYVAALVFLLVAPCLHAASLLFALLGMRSGSRLTAFICILLNIVFIAIDFLFGAAALFG